MNNLHQTLPIQLSQFVKERPPLYPAHRASIIYLRPPGTFHRCHSSYISNAHYYSKSAFAAKLVPPRNLQTSFNCRALTRRYEDAGACARERAKGPPRRFSNKNRCLLGSISPFPRERATEISPAPARCVYARAALLHRYRGVWKCRQAQGAFRVLGLLSELGGSFFFSICGVWSFSGEGDENGIFMWGGIHWKIYYRRSPFYFAETGRKSL